MSLKRTALFPIMFVFLLLLFTAPLIKDASALGSSYDLIRPKWMNVGDYVTYLFSVTVSGVTGTVHMRVTMINDTTPYLNQIRIETFGAEIPTNFPQGWRGQLDERVEQSGFAEGLTDSYLTVSNKTVMSEHPPLEEVKGLNGRTYQAYKFNVVGFYPNSDYPNSTIWFDKETLVRVKQVDLCSADNCGNSVRMERIIEDTNIPQLAGPSTTSNTTTGPLKTVTTTVYITFPQVALTTTTTITETITVTGSKTVEATTVTGPTTIETRTDSSTYAWAIGASTIAALLAIALLRRKR
ncbi:MAG: hypothetical protein HYY22_01170 [Thaumarchaeota archaeon]|nr:hypothetical protein [Nitrososphaerota archaeon]